MKKPGREYSIPDFLADTLSKFPSDAEKERVLKSLDSIIRYFQAMKERVESLPHDNRQNEVLSAIDVVKSFLQTATDNPSLAAALGLQYEKSRFPRPRKEVSPEEGERLFNELKSLSTGEIQQKLLDYKSISMDKLRALAVFLGIKSQEKTRRQDLIDRIVKSGFANVRGYELLRTDDNK